MCERNAPKGTDRPSCQVREQLENDEKRLAMRQGDIPPPIPERAANPRTREDRRVQFFRLKSEKMHRATYEDANRRAWFQYCRCIIPESVRKASSDVDLHNGSTPQCSILFNNMGSFTGRLRICTSRFLHIRTSKSPTTLRCHFSNLGETFTCQ